MSDHKIVVYGTRWCGDCLRTQRVLKDKNILFDFINIDQDRDAEQIVIRLNKGMRSVPTILFPDGTFLVEPSNSQLTRKLEFFTSRKDNFEPA